MNISELIKACETRDLRIINSAIKNNHMCLNLAGRYAGSLGDLTMVKYLIDMGANVNAIIEDASVKGCLEIVKFLVDKGANISTNDNFPIKYACYYGHTKLVDFFINRGIDIHYDNDLPLRFAINGGHLNTVKYLVAHGANIHSAISIACITEKLEIIAYLIEMGVTIDEIPAETRGKVEKYIEFCIKMRWKIRVRATKKIYFWWIPICYDISRKTGIRMMRKNYEEYKRILNV